MAVSGCRTGAKRTADPIFPVDRSRFPELPAHDQWDRPRCAGWSGSAGLHVAAYRRTRDVTNADTLKESNVDMLGASLRANPLFTLLSIAIILITTRPEVSRGL